jgi:hypothetical protein
MAKVRIKDKNRIPEIINSIEELDGATIRVGIFGTEANVNHNGSEITMGHLAAIHEFGTKIPVTEKMRKYLASQGLYLKKDTTFINIPERSFIRSGWDENEQDMMDKAVKLIKDAIAKGKDMQKVLDAIGLESSGRLQTFARDLRDPANHPFTVQQKSSSNPLADTGQMIQAIDYEVL